MFSIHSGRRLPEIADLERKMNSSNCNNWICGLQWGVNVIRHSCANEIDINPVCSVDRPRLCYYYFIPEHGIPLSVWQVRNSVPGMMKPCYMVYHWSSVLKVGNRHVIVHGVNKYSTPCILEGLNVHLSTRGWGCLFWQYLKPKTTAKLDSLLLPLLLLEP